MNAEIVQELEEIFKLTPAPDKQTCMALGKKYHYSDKTIYRWFWERRNQRVPKSVKSTTVRVIKDIKPPPSAVTSSSSEIPLPNVVKTRSSSLKRKIDPSSLTPLMIIPPSSKKSNLLIQDRHQNTVQQNFNKPSIPPRHANCHLNEQRYAELFGHLTFREVSVLEKVFVHMNNPSKDDIARLANRFVREQEKETQIIEWFNKRRHGQAVANHSAFCTDYNTHQPEMQITNIQQRYQMDSNNLEEMHFEISPDTLWANEVNSPAVSSPEPSQIQSAISVPDDSTDSEVVANGTEEPPIVYVENASLEENLQNAPEIENPKRIGINEIVHFGNGCKHTEPSKTSSSSVVSPGTLNGNGQSIIVTSRFVEPEQNLSVHVGVNEVTWMKTSLLPKKSILEAHLKESTFHKTVPITSAENGYQILGTKDNSKHGESTCLSSGLHQKDGSVSILSNILTLKQSGMPINSSDAHDSNENPLLQNSNKTVPVSASEGANSQFHILENTDESVKKLSETSSKSVMSSDP